MSNKKNDNSEKDKMSGYSALQKYNGLALDALSNIGIGFAGNKPSVDLGSIEEEFYNSVGYVIRMAESCVALGTGISLEKIVEKINIISQSSIGIISSSKLTLELEYQDTSLEEMVKDGLYMKVQRLSQEMRSPGKEEFNLENTQTLHDMIRYLHQLGVDNAYDMSNVEDMLDSSSIKVIKLSDNDDMKLVDVDKILPSGNINAKDIEHPILSPIIELYKKGLEKDGEEEFKGILTKNKLLTQMHIGCHYAELEVHVGGNNHIGFMFRNTKESSYRNAPYRTKYVVNVLKKLGYDPKTEGIETKAQRDNIPQKEMPQAIKDIIRMTASTKDLDISGSKIDQYLNKSVNAFFDNVTNIYEYLKTIKSGVEDDKKIL